MASETHSADEPPLIKCPSPCDTAISWLTGEEKCPRCGKLAPSQLRLTRSQFDTIVDYCFSTTSSSSRDTSFVVDRTLLGQLTSQIAGRPTSPLEGLPVQHECVSASEFDVTHDETTSERLASTDASSALHVGGSGHDDDKDDDVITIIDEDDKSIMCPEGYDKDCFDSLPPHIKSEVCEEAASVALARKLSGRINESKSKREVAGLCDFNTPGLRGIAPNTTAAVTSLDRHPTRVLREKKCDVTVRNFLPGRDADDSSMQAVGDKPIYFHMDDIGTKITWPSNYVLGIAEDLKKEILSHFSATDNMQEEKERKLVEIPELIFDGYFKGRLNNEFSSKFSETLPNTFQVKKNASQKGIVFLNTKDGQCDTHYDRDASVLFLITGYKEVLIAPPRRIASVSAAGNESNSTIFSHIDPFAEDKKGDWEWKKVNLTPGSALYIPQDYLHCIRSTEDTLALSFQVEPYRQSSSSSRSNKRKRQRHRSDRAPVPRESPVDHMISAAAAISSLASTAATASVSTPAAVADAPAVPAAASVANKSSSGRSTFPSRHIVDGQKRTCATTGTGSPRPSPPAHADSEPPSARSAPSSVIENDGQSHANRRERVRHQCGICRKRAFIDGTTWLLHLKIEHKASASASCPMVPLKIRKHLLCMNCRPQNGAWSVSPTEEFEYQKGQHPLHESGGRYPILSEKEFSDQGMSSRDYSKYEFVSASKVDYVKSLSPDIPLLGRAGEEATIRPL